MKVLKKYKKKTFFSIGLEDLREVDIVSPRLISSLEHRDLIQTLIVKKLTLTRLKRKRGTYLICLIWCTFPLYRTHLFLMFCASLYFYSWLKTQTSMFSRFSVIFYLHLMRCIHSWLRKCDWKTTDTVIYQWI